MAQKKNRKRAWGFSSEPQVLRKYIQQVDRYIIEEEWSKAEKLLAELDQRFPQEKEVLESWLSLCYEKGDWKGYQKKAMEYKQKFPDDPEGYLVLSSICINNSYPLLAVECLKEFRQKFPNHSHVDEANQTIEKLTELVPKLLKEYDIPEEQVLEIGLLTEQGRFLFESNQYPEAKKSLQDLIKLMPNLPPALNNLSLIYYFEQDLPEAINLAKQVLESHPDNFHALGNITRFYLVSGETDLAQKSLNQLKALDNKHIENWLKKAETLALFGDWTGLVKLGKEAEKSEYSEDLKAFFWHFIAVGYANLGKEIKARQLWERALEIAPGFEYARENLANIMLPSRERATPWAFEIQELISPTMKEDIDEMGENLDSDEKLHLITQKILKKNPYLTNVIPILLKRGSPTGRQFAIHIANFSREPHLQEVLKEFALGKEGSDRDRLDVAQELCQKGLIPSGNFKMWIQGEQKEVILMGMEITDDPIVTHSPKVLKLVQKAIMLLRQEKGKEAESILKQALVIEPSAPDLKYNLANAYMSQDRAEKAMELIREIHAESPDYAFATIALARHHIKEGELEVADELLKPLLQKRQFHFSEIYRLCDTQIELCMKKKMPESAKSWLSIWQQIGDEDDSNLQYWCNRLDD
jgi:tetratricopeptide (TPR) repeat protein